MPVNNLDLDRLKYISEIHRSQFNERRKIEWRIVFTVLGFYFGMITIKVTEILKGNDEPTSLNFLIILGIIFIIIVIVAIFYLSRIHKANHINKKIAEKAENAIMAVLQHTTPNFDIFPPTRQRNEWEQWEKWSWVWQSILLFIIAISAILILIIL